MSIPHLYRPDQRLIYMDLASYILFSPPCCTLERRVHFTFDPEEYLKMHCSHQHSPVQPNSAPYVGAVPIKDPSRPYAARKGPIHPRVAAAIIAALVALELSSSAEVVEESSSTFASFGLNGGFQRCSALR